MNARNAAVQVLQDVLGNHHSLSRALPPVLERLNNPADRALTRELCSGVLRWYPALDAVLNRLLTKPLKAKDLDVQCVLLIGLYQIVHLRVPHHAAVSETVNTVQTLRKPWARNLVNGVLRNFLRTREAVEAALADDEEAATAHPAWFLHEIQHAWPQYWPAMVEANNQRPPMTLRVNTGKTDRPGYLARLEEAGIAATPAPFTEGGLTLGQATGVEALPGFTEGWVSVQDGAAQLAAVLLDAQAGERVVDACAAPGGKTGHILERQPHLATLVALDNDPQRLDGVADNLGRLGLRAKLIAADAADTGAWWDGQLFDRILLDAPCSATGVIRRNPDIKILRRAADIAALVEQQRRLLDALWPLLKINGILLYSTCSVLPQENERQVADFLQRHPDAGEVNIAAEWGHAVSHGRQILPGEHDMDGFYYARLEKR